MSNSKRAVILLSGGLDSTVTACVARERDYALTAITFQYGQKHSRELRSAARVARALGVIEHLSVSLPSDVFVGPAYRSQLVGSGPSSPESLGEERRFKDIPGTYVPGRNLIFLSYAAAVAETRSASALFIGANCVDYSGYPDCRPAFISSFESTANLALASSAQEGAKLRVEAPLLHLTKADIVREGVRLGAPLELTHSCYFPTSDGSACGKCQSCYFRLEGFKEAGVTDPVRYALCEA